MTAGLVEPILVLSVGNLLLSDDGVGMILLDELSRDPALGDQVEFVDGGTQGLALLGQFTGRDAVVLLDAIALGACPGTVHVLSSTGLPTCAPGSGTSHDTNALELLRFAALLDELPEQVRIIGIEPEKLATGIGLSETVASAVPAAVERAKTAILELQKALLCVSQYQERS